MKPWWRATMLIDWDALRDLLDETTPRVAFGRFSRDSGR